MRQNGVAKPFQKHAATVVNVPILTLNHLVLVRIQVRQLLDLPRSCAIMHSAQPGPRFLTTPTKPVSHRRILTYAGTQLSGFSELPPGKACFVGRPLRVFGVSAFWLSGRCFVQPSNHYR